MKQLSSLTETSSVGKQVDVDHDAQSHSAFCHDADTSVPESQGPCKSVIAVKSR